MRILWLKTELLHPVDKGGKIRTFQMLRELRKYHQVTYLTLDDGTADPDALDKASEYCSRVITIPHKVAEKFSRKFYLELAANAASQLPYALQKYVSGAMRSAVTDAVESRDYDVLVSDFLSPAVNIPDDLSIPTVLFQHNVEAMIWQRHYEVSRNPVKRAFLRSQWRRMLEYEKKACVRFDRVVAVSKEDALTISRDYGVDNVADVPTGVDTEYFSPAAFPEKSGNTVVFTGSMDWLPNGDGIEWFIETVWPTVKERVEGASLVVVGRNPFASLLDRAANDRTITVTGRVEDVRPYMANARVFVVPIRIGGGTRLKIYEAMAMGLPVVSTTIGAEGLPLRADEEVLLRNDPVGFAETVVRLLQDREFAASIGGKGAATVRTKFGWSSAAGEFSRQCQIAIDQGRARSAKGADTVSALAVSA